MSTKTKDFDAMYPHYDIDGGWAWMVMVASFVGCFITSGVCFANGIYYNVYLSLYPEQKLLIAVLTSLPSALFLLMGPVSLFTSRRFGYHMTVGVGAVLGSAGFALSYLTLKIPILCVTQGLLVGVGSGLIYSPVVCALKLCFVRRYVLANAFGLSGIACGSLAYPLMYHFFIQNFGVRGSLLVNGGVYLHTFLIAVTLANHPGTIAKTSAPKSEEKHRTESVHVENTPNHESANKVGRSASMLVDLRKLPNGNYDVLSDERGLATPEVSKSATWTAKETSPKRAKLSQGSSTDESLIVVDAEYPAFPPVPVASHLAIPYCSVKNVLFMAYALLEQCSCLIIILMMPKFALGWGTAINSFEAGTLVSWIGLGELGGSLTVVAWGYYHAKRSRTQSSPYTGIVFMGALLVQGWISVAFLMGLSKLYLYFCVMVFLFGFFYAIRISLLNCIMIDLYGSRHFTHVYSWYFLFSGSGAIVSIPLATWLAAAVRTQFAMFYITTTTFGLCVVILSFVTYHVYYHKMATHFEEERAERKLKILMEETNDGHSV